MSEVFLSGVVEKLRKELYDISVQNQGLKNENETLKKENADLKENTILKKRALDAIDKQKHELKQENVELKEILKSKENSIAWFLKELEAERIKAKNEVDELKKHHKEIWEIMDEIRVFRCELTEEKALKIMGWTNEVQKK